MPRFEEGDCLNCFLFHLHNVREVVLMHLHVEITQEAAKQFAYTVDARRLRILPVK